jgi:dihydrofolate synthase/folylpolyglutamate synthase
VDPIEFLLSLEVLGMKFGLENMRRLCSALDHPELAFRSVLVAGTNGKGSVTAMVSAALYASGRRVGRYTSPHLLRLEERFVIDETEVDTADLRAAAGQVQRAVQTLLDRGELEGPPTFFECTTATAFELFRRAGVDIAVLEVGLGGRLDATNVVTPVAAAITSIDVDHQAQLGSTIAAIAREKSGIVKPGVPVVVGPLPQEADAVVAETCQEHGAPLIRIGRDVSVEAALRDGLTFVSIATTSRRLRNVRLALTGRHQASNAAVAVALLDQLSRVGLEIEDEAVVTGLSAARWPARLERLRWRNCDVLLDAAHNPAGARALADYLREARWSDVTLVFGAMRDKDVSGMLKELLPLCAVVICTTAQSPRAMRSTELGEISVELAGSTVRVETIPEPRVALARACELERSVVAAGSIFLIGPLRDILR